MRQEIPSPTAAQQSETPLNPSLKSGKDPSYGPAYQGTDFMESVSVKKKEEGRAWPMIWAVTFIACVVVTVLLIL